MAFDLQEQEQIAELKAFWHDYGRHIALGVAVALAVFAGWKGWQAWQSNQVEKASALFAKIESANSDASKRTAAIEELKKNFSGSPYAARAALISAGMAFSGKDLAKAGTELKWVIDNSKEAVLRDLARVRLANVLMDEKKYDEALTQLKSAEDQSFGAVYSETRGDVLTLKGDKAGATDAYKQALAKLNKDAPNYKLVEVKLESVGN